MKKVLFMLMLILATTVSFAQETKVTTAQTVSAKVIEYYIIDVYSLQELQRIANTMIKQGYQPFGPLICQISRTSYIQVMIKTE